MGAEGSGHKAYCRYFNARPSCWVKKSGKKREAHSLSLSLSLSANFYVIVENDPPPFYLQPVVAGGAWAGLKARRPCNRDLLARGKREAKTTIHGEKLFGSAHCYFCAVALFYGPFGLSCSWNTGLLWFFCACVHGGRGRNHRRRKSFFFVQGDELRISRSEAQLLPFLQHSSFRLMCHVGAKVVH